MIRSWLLAVSARVSVSGTIVALGSRAPDVREAGHNRDVCKVPVNDGEAIFDVVGHEGLQEHAPVQIRALAIAHKGCAVGQFWGRLGHGRYLG